MSVVRSIVVAALGLVLPAADAGRATGRAATEAGRKTGQATKQGVQKAKGAAARASSPG